MGQHGDWLHVRLYEFDEEEEEEDEDKHRDHDVRHEACNKLTLQARCTRNGCRKAVFCRVIGRVRGSC